MMGEIILSLCTFRGYEVQQGSPGGMFVTGAEQMASDTLPAPAGLYDVFEMPPVPYISLLDRSVGDRVGVGIWGPPQ